MIEQGSDEWKRLRLGKITASRLGDLLARTKSGPSASRENYIVELALQQVTGEIPTQGFESAAIKWGKQQEPFARMAYEAETGEIVQEVDFIDHPGIEGTGASPDGLVGDYGLVEIKCPESKEHLRILRGGEIPIGYVYQMQWQMECCYREWCDFVSYDPRFPEHARLHVRRVLRDNDAIDKVIVPEVIKALAEIKQTVEDIKTMKKAA